MTTKEEPEEVEKSEHPVKSICRTILCVCCLGCAMYLIMNDKTGWGWFIFLALCC